MRDALLEEKVTEGKGGGQITYKHRYNRELTRRTKKTYNFNVKELIRGSI